MKAATGDQTGAPAPPAPPSEAAAPAQLTGAGTAGGAQKDNEF